MTHFSISTRLLQAVGQFTSPSRNEVRDVLLEVDHEKESALLVATNGAALIACDVTKYVTNDPMKWRCLISNEMINSLPEAQDIHDAAEFQINGERLIAHCQRGVRVSAKIPQVGFPIWRKVIPQGAPVDVSRYSFDADRLRSFVAVDRAFGGQGMVRIATFGQYDPVVVRSCSDFAQGWYGLLMPVRSDKMEITPSWLK